jgi:hypothetical protein
VLLDQRRVRRRAIAEQILELGDERRPGVRGKSGHRRRRENAEVAEDAGKSVIAGIAEEMKFFSTLSALSAPFHYRFDDIALSALQMPAPRVAM